MQKGRTVVIKKGVVVLAGPMIAVSITTSKVSDGSKLASITPVHKPADKAASYRPVAILLGQEVPQLPARFPPQSQHVGGHLCLPWLLGQGKICRQGHRHRHIRPQRSLRHLGPQQDPGQDARALDQGEDKLLVQTLPQQALPAGNLQQSPIQSPANQVWSPPQGSILGPFLFLCLLVDLPDVISNSTVGNASVGSSGYADDCIVWAMAKDAATVKANLESVSISISPYMTSHCLILNQEKTQILWVGDGSTNSPVLVGNTHWSVVSPSCVVDVLGVSFDNCLNPAPHLASMLR